MNVFTDWEKAKPILERAVPELHGTHTIDDICLMIGMGALTLWATDKSAALTQFTMFPRLKVLHIFLCGGDLLDLRRLLDEKLKPYALANGCTRITGAGRRGWSRVPSDWEYGGIYMHKDIS